MELLKEFATAGILSETNVFQLNLWKKPDKKGQGEDSIENVYIPH